MDSRSRASWCFLSGSSFKDGLNLIVKSPGLLVPLFSLFIEEMWIARSSIFI